MGLESSTSVRSMLKVSRNGGSTAMSLFCSDRLRNLAPATSTSSGTCAARRERDGSIRDGNTVSARNDILVSSLFISGIQGHASVKRWGKVRIGSNGGLPLQGQNGNKLGVLREVSFRASSGTARETGRGWAGAGAELVPGELS